MLIYVAHEYGGKQENVDKSRKITHDLQMADLDNCYISSLLALSHIDYKEAGNDYDMQLCIDLLSVCDKLLVASDISSGVEREIEFAEMVGMPVEWLDEKED